ncbi:hypothetical protein B0H11DRAFT_2230938 [Mycena galericulata]|nr:hypothetical protein B0H11DRAFT_2230938 [Mycena galericulata]
MDDTDSNWCAVCDRQIVPKRTIVPIQLSNPPPSPNHDSARRKQGTRGGLVHGTGRVRLNGTIKRSEPVKTRIEIDQSPAPLYCSDECRQKDLEFFHGRRPVYSDSADSASDSASDDSLQDRHLPPPRSTPNTRSLAILQREYGMAPLPPPTSETYNELAPRKQPAPYRPPEYTSGVMMANRRLEAVLPKPLKPGERAPPLKPVPGWTDGSQAWRASTYSFAPPPRTRADILDPNRAAYESFVASPHRSAASGVTASSSAQSSHSAPPSPTSATPSSLNSELLSSFEDSFARRTSSRLSLFSPSSSPASSSGSPPRKQRPLSQLAGGMLLVPNVLMRAPRASGSSTSLSSERDRRDSMDSTRSTGRRHSAGAANSPAASFPGRRVRSPLSGSGLSASSLDDDIESAEPEDDEEAAYVRTCGVEALPPPRRPNIETRSWSYDNVRTYPVMAMPATKELRVVDGVEVEVEVPRPFKKLFTFAPVEVSAGGA